MPKRMKYSAKYKLLVIKFAEETNNCAAARKYNVNEKLVRDWRKNADKLSQMPKSKCADRGKTCQWLVTSAWNEKQGRLLSKQNGGTLDNK